MFHASPYLLWVAGIAVLLVLALSVALWYLWRRYNSDLDEAVDELLENTDDPVKFKPPDVRTSPVDLFRIMRHYQRAQRLAKKGYVKSIRLGSTYSRPTWVKPEPDGTGVPEADIDGETYYFPKESMVPDQMTGAWVAVHREGEGDPLDLRDPAYPGIPVDLVERIVNLKAEDKPPGFLDDLLGGWDQQALMWGGIALLFVIYAAYQYMG